MNKMKYQIDNDCGNFCRLLKNSNCNENINCNIKSKSKFDHIKSHVLLPSKDRVCFIMNLLITHKILVNQIY